MKNSKIDIINLRENVLEAIPKSSKFAAFIKHSSVRQSLKHSKRNENDTKNHNQETYFIPVSINLGEQKKSYEQKEFMENFSFILKINLF